MRVALLKYPFFEIVGKITGNKTVKQVLGVKVSWLIHISFVSLYGLFTTVD